MTRPARETGRGSKGVRHMKVRIGLGAAALVTGFAATGAAAQTSPCPPGYVFDNTVPTAPTFPCRFVGGANGGTSSSGYTAAEPRYGSPNSIQFQQADTALAFDDFDPDTIGALGPDGDADTIGGAFTYWGAGGSDGERLDLRYRHARRLGEGSRARLLLDGVLNINHLNGQKGLNGGDGATAVYGTISGGVELPVQPNWVITPRLNYSNLQAGQFYGKDAESLGGSVTSRAKLGQLGRGEFVLGNTIAYSHTIDTFLAEQPFYDNEDFWTFRNGLAYQLPLKMRFSGRQTSLRGSYVFSYLTGAAGLNFRQVHELGLNIGVRAREVETKSGFEKLRLGVLYTHARNEFSGKADYDSVTLTLGYRF